MPQSSHPIQVYSDARSPELPTLEPRIAEAGTQTLLNQRSLELGHRGGYYSDVQSVTLERLRECGK